MDYIPYVRLVLLATLLGLATACAPRCHTQMVEFTWYAADGTIERVAPQTFLVCSAR